jgi:hypothetical protein
MTLAGSVPTRTEHAENGALDARSGDGNVAGCPDMDVEGILLARDGPSERPNATRGESL